MKPKLLWIFLLVTAVLTFFVAAFYVQKNILPQQIRSVQTNLNVPVRYAFITDTSKAQVAVLDTYTDEVIEVLALKAVPDLIAISRLGGYLAYAERGGKTIYLIDLETHRHEEISVKDSIRQLSADSSGKWLIYAGETAVYQLHRQDKKNIRTIAINGVLSLVYRPDGEAVYIAELDRGRIRQLSFIDGKLSELLDVGEAISPLSVMPDSQALLFNSQGKIYRYHLIDKKVTEKALSTLPYRPYISSDNRTLFVIAQADNVPQLLALNPTDLSLLKAYPLKSIQALTENTSIIATGWLDQVAIVAGQQSLALIDLHSGETHNVGYLGKLLNMVVQSDSKTLLLDTTAVEQANLISIDLRQRTVKNARLIDAIVPNHIVMGQTNTLCH